MAMELAPVRAVLRLRPVSGGGVLEGRVGPASIVARRIGVGTERATHEAEQMLDSTPVDHVLVVGVAGGIGAARVRDPVIPDVVIDGASGDEFRPHHLVGTGVGRLRTGDDFVTEPERIAALVAAGVTSLDMETAAVARVCEARGVPWSVVRAVSDLATDHHDDSVLTLLHPDGSVDVGSAARMFVSRPAAVVPLARMAANARGAARRAATIAGEHLRAAAAAKA